MPRHGKTNQRGYGIEHQRTTAQLKAAMRDGQPCARGGEPLYRWQLALAASHPQSIDGDHGQARALGGTRTDSLSCAHHNRQHGARLGNRMRGLRIHIQAQEQRQRPDILTTSRDW
jgi:hypothetical protein